jgi:hypothetical protein
LKDLSIQIGQAGSERVELRLTEQGGQLRVAVRTADSELAQGLRQTLPDLVARLEGSGFRAEAWRPSEVASGPVAPNDARQNAADSGSGDPQQQSGWSHRERGQQDQDQPSRPKWIAELEGDATGGNREWTGEIYGFSN